MSERLVVVGAGGFGRETLGVIAAMNDAGQGAAVDLAGVLDDDPGELNLDRLAALGIAYLGSIDDWIGQGVPGPFVVAIGSPAIREPIVRRFEEHGHRPATLVHPQATIGLQSTLGEGSVVCAGVQVSTNVTIGRHTHLNPNATIGHDTVIGDHVSINPGVVVSGDLTIEDRVLVGAGAVILQGLTVHAGSLVGAAACVVRDVPPDVIVKGVPAR